MNIIYKKQAEKYLRKTDRKTYEKLRDAIEGLNTLSGDIVKLKGTNLFRLKIYHYRIIFEYSSTDDIITIHEINARGDVY